MNAQKIILTTLFSMLLALASFSQNVESQITSAIKSGNAANLAKYFNSTIDLETPDNDGSFSSKQAEMIIKSFFTKNQPKSYSVKQTGSSNDGSKFVIGIYQSFTGDSYRFYYLIKNSSGSNRIQLFQIEEE